jgi:hypothetical protein
MAQLNPETDFELMFESAPISLWLEDYSARPAFPTKTRFYEEAKLERRRN